MMWGGRGADMIKSASMRAMLTGIFQMFILLYYIKQFFPIVGNFSMANLLSGIFCLFLCLERGTSYCCHQKLFLYSCFYISKFNYHSGDTTINYSSYSSSCMCKITVIYTCCKCMILTYLYLQLQV